MNHIVVRTAVTLLALCASARVDPCRGDDGGAGAAPPPPPGVSEDLVDHAVRDVAERASAGEAATSTVAPWVEKLEAAERTSQSVAERARLLDGLVLLSEMAGRWDEHYRYLLRLLLSASSEKSVERALLTSATMPTLPKSYSRALVGRPSTNRTRAEAMLDALDEIARRFPKTKVAALSMLAAAEYLLLLEDASAAKSLLRSVESSAPTEDERGAAHARLWRLEHLVVGSPAPVTTWKPTSGSPVTVGVKRGKPIVVYAWTSDCGAVASLLPELRVLETELKGSVDFIGLNFDDSMPTFSDPATPWPGPAGAQVHMPSQVDGARWPFDVFPHVVVLRADGVVLSENAPTDQVAALVRTDAK